VDLATDFCVAIILAQSLEDVIIGASGDSRELQKTIKGVFMP
jgi:hypothetical protein